MVNFEDPAIIAQDFLTVAKLWSAVDGLYIWEFITTLNYEWSIIRGRRSHNWTIWIYSTTRLAAFASVILNIQTITMSARYNCEAEIVFQLIIGYLAIASASLLIVLRILAIWNKKRAVVALAFSVWGINIIFTIQSIARIFATWSPLLPICVIVDMDVLKINILVTLCTDIALLLMMLFGLLSKHLYERSTFGLGRHLWKQGLIWFLIATLAEALPAVLLCLNLNRKYRFYPVCKRRTKR
jgi:hypothetical protein